MKMNNLTDLKMFLYNYVRDYENAEKKITTLENRLSDFQELIKLLKNSNTIIENMFTINIYLKRIYNDSEYELLGFEKKYLKYHNSQDSKDYDTVMLALQKIAADYKLENNSLDIEIANQTNLSDMIQARRIISNIKYNKLISDNQITFIKKLLEKSGYSREEIITVLEKVKILNEKCSHNKIKCSELYYIIELMHHGYEQIDLPEGNFSHLDTTVTSLINAINGLEKKEVNEVLNGYKYFQDIDQEYLYKKIMMYYQDSMYDIIEMLKDESGYFDPDMVEAVKEDYEKASTNFLIAREKYNELEEKIEQETIDSIETDEQIEYANCIYYSTNTKEPNKCYLISDLSNIREESYYKIYSLIEDFKKGKLSRMKSLKEQKNCIELKYDQIRIVLKALGNKQFSLQGVFIKKSDNDRKTYDMFCHARPTAQIDYEYSKEVEKYFKEFIKENARKGKRK